ncbi:MAG TPA: SIS domain-containing protein [Bacillaceae bacterium]
MITQYFKKIDEIFQVILASEQPAMEIAAEKISESIMNGGIIQLFGSGHSHLLTEEVFYRAGGLVPVKPIFVEPLMLHEGAFRSSELEREKDYAGKIIAGQDIRPEDVVFVISNSGRNPVPIEFAVKAKEMGAFTIALTSLDCTKKQPSRHISGRHLHEFVDLVLDNHIAAGDAILTDNQVKVPFAAASTIVGSAILNAIFAKAITHMAAKGFDPPIFLSGNIDGGDAHNKKQVQKYKTRIPLLS